MDYSKPALIVISGPKGAGKSTYIQSMLPAEFKGIWSFDRGMNRLEFEKILQAKGVKTSELFRSATDMMEQRLVQEMKKAISVKDHFVLETPFSHQDYWTYIDLFERSAYQVQLNLFVP